ncbi:hypothetical protein FRB94_006279 [Tulasnella sp. JGI-2019a]|nr:hypothetical protein FRB93_006676 [Tulasnella sp. JGI-2019a]KAG8999294.1 hypothetical protein FRB94_006279 [Tulasnella sp. JGI-2019a]KAG9026039.1 hypothetical protein FRB95_009473 [Tulasnella sp. JGI-2019a]
MAAHKPKPTPWPYFLIRLLFKFVLNVFYGTIVIENEHYIPDDGEPVILCANHTNSLTDALLLVTSVSSKKRSFLRLTAKDTQFGRKTFSSWLIESCGTLPIQRRSEHGDQADNKSVMNKLLTALEEGDAVCLFPEGFSHYRPKMAPLKTGVARIVSDVLSRNHDNPDFAVTVLTCSLTYVHRQSFRSDVLVSFNPPIRLTVKDTPLLVATPEKPVVPFEAIRSLTSFMHAQLVSNTIEAPSWDLVRTGKAAARIYVPLGTRMRLGDWVRVVARFVEGFTVDPEHPVKSPEAIAIEKKGTRRNASFGGKELLDFTVMKEAEKDGIHEGEGFETNKLTETEAMGNVGKISDADREQLSKDIAIYQDHLSLLGLKDDRIRREERTRRTALLWRLTLRILITFALFLIALPGLILWLPIFLTTAYFVRRLKLSGRPIWDTGDEVAETKLLYGLTSGILVWMAAVIFTLPIFHLGLFLTIWIVPAWMWLTLRWTEDLVAAFRASMALYRMLKAGPAELKRMREMRKYLHGRVMDFATRALGLPGDPETEFAVDHGNEEDGDEDDRPNRWGKHQRGRTHGGWDSAIRYFSIRRRRKRDWNETLRWFDATDFPK